MVENKHARIKSDNVTAVAYINNLGEVDFHKKKLKNPEFRKLEEGIF